MSGVAILLLRIGVDVHHGQVTIGKVGDLGFLGKGFAYFKYSL